MDWVYWRTGRGGGGAGGLKGARTSLPISLSRAQIACLIVVRVCRVLESAMGSTLYYVCTPIWYIIWQSFQLLLEQHLSSKHSPLVWVSVSSFRIRRGWAKFSMVKLELPKVAQAGAEVGGTIHGDLLAQFKELQSNDRNCFVKEMITTMVQHFEAEGNIIPGHSDCQMVHC